MIQDAHSLLNKYIQINSSLIDHIIANNQSAINDVGIRNEAVKDVLGREGFYPFVSKIINSTTVGCDIGIISFQIKTPHVLRVAPLEPVSYIGKLLFGKPHRNIEYLKVIGQYHVNFPDEEHVTFLVCQDPSDPSHRKEIIRYIQNKIVFIESDAGFLKALKRLQINRS
ncbi:hypothetical protein KLEB273_gp271 [Bacillus phage vB_BauM_KLEB27-3]|nr:hypothetical protein KLEB273_gp271 [Bacillus phage vB_BauM_KLEB27-3]